MRVLASALAAILFFSPILEIMVTAHDPEDDDVWIEVHVDGSESPVVVGENEVITELSGLEPGDHNWTAVLNDGFDSVEYGPWQFSVNHDPTVRYLGPDDGESVENSFPLRWRGKDQDNDGLTYHLHLGSSSDPGLIRELTGTEHSHFLYPGTYYWYVEVEDPFIRVSGEVRSFVVPAGIAPMVTIQEIGPIPAVASETISFKANAEDEDGTIEVIEWYSDLDGVISDTLAFETSQLSPGEHTIHLNVTDNEGNVGSESVQLLVLASGSKSPRTIFIPPLPPSF